MSARAAARLSKVLLRQLDVRLVSGLQMYIQPSSSRSVVDGPTRHGPQALCRQSSIAHVVRAILVQHATDSGRKSEQFRDVPHRSLFIYAGKAASIEEDVPICH